MSLIRKITKHRSLMLRNPKPRVKGQCRKLGKPRFRHYPFTYGLELLGLHRRRIIDLIYHSYQPR